MNKATLEELVEQVIGMEYHEAMEITESCGFLVRVVMKDKQPRSLTDDENDQRLNLVVVDSFVTQAAIG